MIEGPTLIAVSANEVTAELGGQVIDLAARVAGELELMETASPDVALLVREVAKEHSVELV